MGSQVKIAESTRDNLANTTKPLLDTIYSSSVGSSSGETYNILYQLCHAPDRYQTKIKKVATMGASQALASVKSLYPRVDTTAVGEGYAEVTSPEQAMVLINEAYDSATKIAKDVMETLQLF